MHACPTGMRMNAIWYFGLLLFLASSCIDIVVTTNMNSSSDGFVGSFNSSNASSEVRVLSAVGSSAQANGAGSVQQPPEEQPLQQLNIGYLLQSNKKLKYGSQFLRGLMISDYVQAHPQCNTSRIFTHSVALSPRKQLHACVIVKFPASKAHLVPACRQRGAVIVHDIVDSEPILNTLSRYLHQPKFKAVASAASGAFVEQTSALVNNAATPPVDGSTDENHNIIISEETVKLPLIHASMGKGLERIESAVWLVQSQQLTTALNGIGIRAYYLPHHHTNLGGWGRVPAREIPEGDRLVVAFLAGNVYNTPRREFEQMLAGQLCAVQAELWMIVQNTPAPPSEGHTKTTHGAVKSIRKQFKCSTDTPQTVKEVVREEIITTTDIAEDLYGQAAYHLDEALIGVDVGLIVPHTYGGRDLTPSDPFTYPMMRPPTRLLHWMSRGVPVMYYPTLAYSEITTLGGYGKFIPFNNTQQQKESNFNMAITDITSIQNLVQRLRPVAIRRHLSQQGIQISGKFGIEESAARFVDIVQHAYNSTRTRPTRKKSTYGGLGLIDWTLLF